MKAAGVCDPFEEHASKPLKEHMADFETTLRGRNVVEQYIEDRMGCLSAYSRDVGPREVGDLDR